MNRVALWLLLFGMALVARAQSPDSEFLQIYSLIQEGDAFQSEGRPADAFDRFRRAREELVGFSKAYPSWNDKIVKFRLEFLAGRLESLKDKAPAASSTPAQAKAQTSASSVTRPGGAPLSPAAMAEQSRLDSLSLDLAAANSRAEEAVAQATAAESRAQSALRKVDEATVKTNESHDRVAQLALELRQARDRVEVLEASHSNLEKTRDRLDRERATLESRLKEALGPKAAAVDPVELARAEDRILLLVKENGILKAGLDRQMADSKRMVESAKKSVELEQQLEGARGELTAVRKQSDELKGERQKLQSRLDVLTRKGDEQTTSLKSEIESLRKDLASARSSRPASATDAAKELASLRTELAEHRSASEKLRSENDSLLREIQKLTDIRVTPGSLKVAEVPSPDSAPVDMAQLRRLERERDALRQQLDAARAELRRQDGASPDQRSRDLSLEVGRLEARISALEAKPDPYTTEELALFQAPAQRSALQPIQIAQVAPSAPPSSTGTGSAATNAPSAPQAAAPRAAASTPTNDVQSAAAAGASTTNRPAATRRRTTRDLPPGASMLAEQAKRAFAQRRLDDAERAYRDILKLDENNVFTLGNLAAIIVEQGRSEEGEVLLKRALAFDAKDPFSLSLLGIMRFRQQRYDEAFAALSEAAQLDPEDPATQTYLGITLSERGQRPAAEAALRKALKLNPTSSAAHYNLAVVYATQKPPFLELARFHYEKARRAGQPANPAFEAVLRGEAAKATAPKPQEAVVPAAPGEKSERKP